SYSSECIYKLFSLDGEELVYTFDSLTPTTNNLIIAYIKNTDDKLDSYLIDDQGDVVSRNYYSIVSLDNGLYHVEDANGEYIINEKDEIIYGDLADFYQHSAYIEMEKNNGNIEYYTLDYELFYTFEA
ncbi:MAG: hypothetical protein R3Y21_04925, partial [Mycoplasmatota bacterium]